MNIYTKEKHKKFIENFKNNGISFYPIKNHIEHLKELDYPYYTKDCMIVMIEKLKVFSKKELYESIGFNKPNKAFDKFWRFLTATRQYAQYLDYDKELKKWVYL